MQFCRVTHIIKHTLPELDGEITGKVRFTPLLGSGDSWQVNEGEFTVPAISVTADITDGVLTYDGKPGIDLFAAGADSTPGRVIYRVDYQSVKSDGHLARMKSFNFVAVPGGEVNLAEVMPVAGDDGQTEPVVGGAVPFHVHRVAQITDLPAITPLPEAEALVQRLENGHVQVPVDPLSPAHAASADYVDSKATPETVSMMISQAIDGLVGTAPDALDTIYELAEYLTDPGLAQGLVAQLGQKADLKHEHHREDILDLPALSGSPSPGALPTYSETSTLKSAAPSADSEVANKAYVDARVPVVRVVSSSEFEALTPEPNTVYMVTEE